MSWLSARTDTEEKLSALDTKLSLLIDHFQHLQTISSIDAVRDLEGEPILTQLQGGGWRPTDSTRWAGTQGSLYNVLGERNIS